MKITAPFTPAQVQVLNERQVHVDGSMPIHSFTCPNRGEGITYDAAGIADDWPSGSEAEISRHIRIR